MHVDRAFVDLRRSPPDKVEQLRSGENAAWLLKQMFEQAKIGEPKANVALATPDAPGEPVQIEVSNVESFSDPFRTAAPEQRVHPGHQFDHRERFDDVVIRAERETAHALRFFAPGTDHDDR